MTRTERLMQAFMLMGIDLRGMDTSQVEIAITGEDGGRLEISLKDLNLTPAVEKTPSKPKKQKVEPVQIKVARRKPKPDETKDNWELLLEKAHTYKNLTEAARRLDIGYSTLFKQPECGYFSRRRTEHLLKKGVILHPIYSHGGDLFDL